MKIAALIKKARGDMSQEDFGLKMGVSLQSVGQWERNDALPGLIVLDRLAPLLGLTYQELVMLWVEEKKYKEGYRDR